jgi:Ca2+-binding EF-hand superfamily protein
MRSILLASLSALLGLALLSPAAAPPQTPIRADDQLDYLFLGSDRPVLFRLHVRVGDRPYDAAWVDFMDKLFAWFDKDNDGSLSSIETARLPSVNGLLNQSRGQIGGEITGVPFATIDKNKDGKVSKEEFRAFYKNGGFPGFQFNANNFQATAAKQVNDGIYKRLDKSGDGSLTADKVAGLYEKLRALDENEDEMLDMSELNTRSNNGDYAGVAVLTLGTRLATVAEPTLLEVAQNREAGLVKQMMDKYDRNKDGKLTPAEVGLSAALFAKLDANKDGFLESGELFAYLSSTPDLVLRLQLGTPGVKGGRGILSRFGITSTDTPSRPRLLVANEKTLDAPMKKALRAGGNDIALELGDTRLSLQVSGAGPQGGRRFNNAKNFYLNQFDTIAGKKGYVERADEKGQQPFLFQIFSQADKNADGKLTRIEVINWLDFVATGQDANVTITANDLGRGLFPVLDADGDGRLSLREMKTAWERLKPLAKDGKVTQADLPRTLRITVGQGDNNNFGPVPVMFVGGMGGPVRSTPRGGAPVWFRKMDRNNDGDISPREWLGTDEEFKAIDADGDGLISVAEALAFDAKKK